MADDRMVALHDVRTDPPYVPLGTVSEVREKIARSYHAAKYPNVVPGTFEKYPDDAWEFAADLMRALGVEGDERA